MKDVKKDTVPFHPYYTVKDGFAIVVFFILFAYFVFFAPNALGHADNSIEANPLVTPAHIVPEWYLLPFYAILRAITFDIGPIEAKLLGVFAMFGSILILFVVPWLDTSKVRSMRYRPMAKQFFLLFVVAAVGLGFCGANDPDKLVVKFSESLVVNYVDTNGVAQVSQKYSEYADATAFAAGLPASAGASIAIQEEGIKWLWLSQLLAAYYFLYFLVILPVLGIMEKPKSRPPSIAESVRGKKHIAPAATVAGGAAPVAAE